LPKEDNPRTASSEPSQEIDRLHKRFNLLDQRLDNLDTMVTAVVERVMSQPISLNVTCPRCGHIMEIILSGVHKPKK
jgi:hypothetical protein